MDCHNKECSSYNVNYCQNCSLKNLEDLLNCKDKKGICDETKKNEKTSHSPKVSIRNIDD